VRWVGNAVCIGKIINTRKILVGNLDEIYYSEGLDVDGRVTVKHMLRKYDARNWTGFIWPTIWTSGGLFVRTVMYFSGTRVLCGVRIQIT
jgi:hypothetical protein